jgi:hypothetical protein
MVHAPGHQLIVPHPFFQTQAVACAWIDAGAAHFNRGDAMLYDIIFRVMVWLAVNGGILPLTALAG